jgi:hypothetical protein
VLQVDTFTAERYSPILCNFQVWEASTKQASGGNADTGAIARLHSALMAVITHLIGRLRHAAMANEQVTGRGGGEARYVCNVGGEGS